MQKSVGGPLGEGGVLNVFAEHASALLLAASEEVSAIVMVGLRLASLVLPAIEIVWHSFLLNRSTKRSSVATA